MKYDSCNNLLALQTCHIEFQECLDILETISNIGVVSIQLRRTQTKAKQKGIKILLVHGAFKNNLGDELSYENKTAFQIALFQLLYYKFYQICIQQFFKGIPTNWNFNWYFLQHSLYIYFDVYPTFWQYDPLFC